MVLTHVHVEKPVPALICIKQGFRRHLLVVRPVDVSIMAIAAPVPALIVFVAS